MRRTMSLLMFVATAVPAAHAAGKVHTSYRASLAPAIDEHVDDYIEGLFAYYQELHSHPELSLHEQQSASKIAIRLREAGFDVATGVGGTGVVGVLKNGAGPTILIRGDMDALPVTEATGVPYRSKVTVTGTDGRRSGVMHACGHDVHQTCLVGTAQLLSDMRNTWGGTLVMVAQPAEEIGKGALMMIQDGLFERFPKPDYCLGLHVSSDQPTGEIGYTPGWAMANVDSVDITIYGRGGHGSRPNQTVDPIVAAAQVVISLQTIVSRRVDPIEAGVVTVGSIHAGSKHNIIPNEARLQLTVRSYTNETRKILLDGIRQITVNTCRAMGCTRDPDVLLREEEFTPASYNDPSLTAAAVKVFGQVVGSERVVEQKARMGGEDFGRFASKLNVPGFMFWLGSIKTEQYQASLEPNGKPLPSLHSSTYVPDPKPTIRTGVRCMASLVLALLDQK